MMECADGDAGTIKESKSSAHSILHGAIPQMHRRRFSLIYYTKSLPTDPTILGVIADKRGRWLFYFKMGLMVCIATTLLLTPKMRLENAHFFHIDNGGLVVLVHPITVD